MSGLLYEVDTPCPPSRLLRFDGNSNESNAFDSTWDDSLDSFEDTANIDFTTEIRAPVLTRAKPRRGNRTISSLQIHEDGKEKTVPPVIKRQRENRTAASSNRKSSLLSQPAQRFRPKVNFAPSPPPKFQRNEMEPKHSIGGGLSVTEENNSLLAQINERGHNNQGKDTLKKGLRRNTLYIPPDDTTVVSAFKGNFSPSKSEKIEGAEDIKINSLESQITTKRQARRAHATSPKRAPLQTCLKVAQEASIQVDIAGKNGGKENIPPGAVLVNRKEKGPARILPAAGLRQKPKTTAGYTPSSRTMATNAARTTANFRSGTSEAKVNGRSENRAVLGDKQFNARASTRDTCENSMGKQKPTPRRNVLISRTSTSANAEKGPRADPKSSTTALKLKKMNNEYPLLAEDITNPAIYEDNWLSHQEIVISQLVNGLFDYTDGKSSFDNPETLRYELLKLYQDSSFAHLHKRLQDSLSNGSMSVPNFILERSSSVKRDLGLKRKLIDIFTQTYDIHALRAAAETIVGRRINDPKPSGKDIYSTEKDAHGDDIVLKRKVEHFLEVFLLGNGDMGHHSDDTDKRTGASGREYRRTVLRSIMIIVLLDKGRLCPGTVLPRRLFSTRSQFKSSAAVLRALGRLLLPSLGDINKPLGHLECRVLYKQQELQEYEYPITNLAVDLRDGVRLTRIAELLLYPSSLCLNGVEYDPDSSSAVLLPDGELLLLSGDDGNYPLSQHLRIPCASRAVKLANVRIALGALTSTKSTRAIVSGVRAEDIVDGHREKTIALLWGLVSKWGLAGLVDWDDMRKEIGRLQHKVMAETGHNQAMSQSWFHSEEPGDEYSFLLRQWASLLAHLKGLHFENLSTNFADGKIYESIVDEYEGYILGSKEREMISDEGSRRQESLGMRLQRLGCSSQFAYLVSPAESGKFHVQTGDFTLVSLAFLCSRLLSASRRARAATSLQRAWRRILARRDDRRRMVAKEIAKQCAAVIHAKDEIVWAQGTIAKWWRQTRERGQQRPRTVDQ